MVEKVVSDPIRRSTVLNQRPKAINQIDCHHKVVHTFNDNCLAFSKVCFVLKFLEFFQNRATSNDRKKSSNDRKLARVGWTILI